jgi:hypothetical protein
MPETKGNQMRKLIAAVAFLLLCSALTVGERRLQCTSKTMPDPHECRGCQTRRCAGADRRQVPLLLVVHRSTHELLTVRVDSTHCDRAALAVGRHLNATTSNALTAFLEVEPQRAVIDLRIRPQV